MLVDQECENFTGKLDNRRKNIFMAVSFFNLAETVSIVLFSTKEKLSVAFCTWTSVSVAFFNRTAKD